MKPDDTPRRILWITAKWPLPALDGSRQASSAGIQQLTSSGETLDLMSFSEQHISANQMQSAIKTLGVEKIFLVPKRQRFKRLSRILNAACSFIFPKSLPFTYIPFRLNNLEKIMEAKTREAWSHVVFDGPHTAASFLHKKIEFPGSKVKFIYRAHNVESSLWDQAARNAFLPIRFFLFCQASKVQFFEQALLSICSGLATVSQEDLNQFKLLYKLPISKVIPIGLNFDEPMQFDLQPHNHPDISLLFVGGVSWGPNKTGLIWFLEEVWPKVCEQRKDISLTIAGRGTDSLQDRFNKLPRLRIMGEVEDLSPLYAKTDATIVPIFYGSGTRVKAIESGRFARACISTTIGVSGLPLTADQSYIRADSRDEWVTTLCNLNRKNLELVGKEAYQSLKATFDKKVVAQSFVQFLESL